MIKRKHADHLLRAHKCVSKFLFNGLDSRCAQEEPTLQFVYIYWLQIAATTRMSIFYASRGSYNQQLLRLQNCSYNHPMRTLGFNIPHQVTSCQLENDAT